MLRTCTFQMSLVVDILGRLAQRLQASDRKRSNIDSQATILSKHEQLWQSRDCADRQAGLCLCCTPVTISRFLEAGSNDDMIVFSFVTSKRIQL